MDLAELEATLARHGLPTGLSDIWRDDVEVRLDALEVGVMTGRDTPVLFAFADEDALCRFILVHRLLQTPGRDRPARPRPRPGPLGPPRADALAPGERWRLAVRPSTRIVHQATGTVVLEDTSALWAHGPQGAIHLTGIDLATGQERWSQALWPPDVLKPVAGVTRDAVLVHEAGRLRCVEPATGEDRWARHWPDRSRVLLDRPGLLVLGDGHGLTPTARALDPATGHDLWPAPRIVRPHRVGEPVGDRMLRAEVDDERLRVLASSVAPEERLLLEVALPPAYAGLRVIALHDQLRDGDRAGHVLVGFGSPRRAEGVLLLRPGRPVQALHATPVRTQDDGDDARTYAPAGPEHVLETRTHPGTRPTRLLTLDGEERWRRPDWAELLSREDGACLLRTLDGRASGVAWVDDDGRERWAIPGSGAAAIAGLVVVRHEGTVRAHDRRTGEERWRTETRDLPVSTAYSLARARAEGRLLAAFATRVGRRPADTLVALA